MSTKSKRQPHTKAKPEDAQTPGTDVAKLSTGAGPEPKVRLKALLTPEFSAWRKNAFAMAEEPGTASWFREALLWLFLMGSVSLSPRRAVVFQFVAQQINGWPDRIELPTKEDPWCSNRNLPVAWDNVPEEAEPAMDEALLALIGKMSAAGAFSGVQDP
jgi:hypothetical protein